MKLAGEVCTKLPQGLLHLDKLAYVQSLPKLRTKLPSTTYKIAPNVVWSLTKFPSKACAKLFQTSYEVWPSFLLKFVWS